MKWPWVLRVRLEFAEQIIAERDRRIAELTEANAKALEAVEAAKGIACEAEKKVEELATKPRRLLGSQIRQMASAEAFERFKENGGKVRSH